MLGRAGRPGYDDAGEAWLLAKSHDEADSIARRYIEAEPEAVISKLHHEPSMRMHLLAAIATGGMDSRHLLGQFFGSTFLATELSREELDDRIDEFINWLTEHELIERLGVDEELSQTLASQASSAAPTKTDEPLPESWQDDLPPWVGTAADFDAVNLLAPKPKASTPRQRMLRNHPASLGFQRASVIAAADSILDSPEPDAMLYASTDFGLRVAQLYIDPLTGHLLRQGLRRAVRRIVRAETGSEVTEFGLLHLLSVTPNFMLLWPREKEFDDLRAKQSATQDDLLSAAEMDPLAFVKSAWVLEKWIEEESLRDIEAALGIAPGDLRVRCDSAAWLLYAAREILLNDHAFSVEHDAAVEQLVQLIDELRQRMRYGCRRELLPLVSLRTVGRVRAREMAGLGIEGLQDLCDTTEVDRRRLAAIHGWSEKLVERLVDEAARFVKKKRKQRTQSSRSSNRKRADDEPLPGERE
jgi:helicase